MTLLVEKRLPTCLIGLAAAMTLVSCVGGLDSESVALETSELVDYSILVKRDSIIDSGASCNNQMVNTGNWFNGGCLSECDVAMSGLASTGFISGPSTAEYTHGLGCGRNIYDPATGTPAGVGVTSSRAYVLKFQKKDDRRSATVGYDWADGLIKGECDSGSAMTGIATQRKGSDTCPSGCYGPWYNQTCVACLFTSWAYGVLAARCAPLVPPSGYIAEAADCQVRDISDHDDREPGSNSSWDWNYGYLKAECGPGRYIKGVAHRDAVVPNGGVSGSTGAGRIVKVLCCSAHIFPQGVVH